MVHFNDWTGQCDPSVSTIAKGVGMSERGVRTCLSSIKDRGYLEYEGNPGGYRSQTNNYMYAAPSARLHHGSGADPCTTKQRSASKTSPTPEKNCRNPCTTVQGTPENNSTRPLNGASAKHLTEQLREHSLEQVRSLARTAHMPEGERAEEGKESKKEAAEGSKPEDRATLERIENGIAYVKVIDHDARLQVIAQYDHLLNKLRAA
jgi:hypothetical protein